MDIYFLIAMTFVFGGMFIIIGGINYLISRDAKFKKMAIGGVIAIVVGLLLNIGTPEQYGYNTNGSGGFGSEDKGNDSGTNNENTTIQNESESTESNSYTHYEFCDKHSISYVPANGCKKCFDESIEEELNKPGGFRDRAMRP